MIMPLFKPLIELSLARFGGIPEKVFPNLSPLGVGELAASLLEVEGIAGVGGRNWRVLEVGGRDGGVAEVVEVSF
jgi:hypothetical protein